MTRKKRVLPILRMDNADNVQWEHLFRFINNRNDAYPERILAYLKELKNQKEGFAVDQLTHGLQTATRAYHAGASEEMVVACLCHDIGKVVLNKGHAEISAAMLKPFVTETTFNVIHNHQDFQARYYGAFLKVNRNSRAKHRRKPWFKLACKFADEWDQCSFDPSYDSKPLKFFEPMIRRVFSGKKDKYSKVLNNDRN